MREKETDLREEQGRPDHIEDERPAVGQAEHPVPGIKYETEPNAENIMPAQAKLGTF